MEELAKKTETAEKKGDLLLFVKIQTALVAVLVLLLVVGGIFAATGYSNHMVSIRDRNNCSGIL